MSKREWGKDKYQKKNTRQTGTFHKPTSAEGDILLPELVYGTAQQIVGTAADLNGVHRIIRSGLHLSAGDLISGLNPKIRGWANYHRLMVSRRTFEHGYHVLYHALRRCARRRHPRKSPSWLKQKYFERYKGFNWCFFGEIFDGDGQLIKIWLQRAAATPIKRLIKVKGEVNPYDPAWEAYFEQREEAHMLRYLWYSQRGLCPVCTRKSLN